MPQPIRVQCQITFEGLTNLPEHAAWMGHIVSLASLIDSNLGYMLAYLTKTSAPIAIAMFHAVTSADAQRAMLNAAAEQQLIGAELNEFKDLMADFRTRAGERNRLVHNIWGISPQHPGKAIWCHAKDFTRLPVTLAITQTADAMPLFTQQYEAIWEKCSSYTIKDMQDAYQRLMDFSNHVRTFIVKLLEQHPAMALPVSPPTSSLSDERPKE